MLLRAAERRNALVADNEANPDSKQDSKSPEDQDVTLQMMIELEVRCFVLIN
jgi:hypothetical protein